MERQVISKLADVDPAFVQVVKSLYGDNADPREMWDVFKAMPDSSALHIPGTGPKKQKTQAQKDQSKKKKLAAGLLAGSTIESFAAKDAAADAKASWQKTKPGYKAATGLKQKAKALKPMVVDGKGKYLPKRGGGTNVALQGGNFLIGLAAAKELTKKPKPAGQLKKSADIEKALPFGRAARAAKSAKMEQDAIGRAQFRMKNQKIAQKGQKVLVASAAGGGAVGGYVGAKRYGLKFQSPVAPSSPEAQPKKIKKNADTDLTWEGEISKVDPDKRLVFGWCSLSKVNGESVVDLQGDYIPIEETESSAYRYVVESRKGGDMHRRVSKFNQDEPMHTADLVESMVFTPEKLSKMGLAPDALPHGWWIGMKVNDDEQWDNVKNGKRLGFSIHGKGRRVEKSL